MTGLFSKDRGRWAIPSGLVVRGRLRPPSSKSITQRLFNLALLAGRAVVVERPLLAEDTRRYLAALERVGLEVEVRRQEVGLRPGRIAGGAELDCGNNGTMLRFLLGALSTLPGSWRLDGSRRLRRRPVGPLARALQTLGARIDFLDRPGFAPLRVQGSELTGGVVDLDARLSSQYASALLMAATRARGDVTMRLESLASAPYLELTRDALAAFGAETERTAAGVYRVRPGELRGGRFRVESDFSAAAYPAAGAVLTGGEVFLDDLDRSSRQGDRAMFDVLSRMGALVEWRDGGVQVAGGGRLRAVDVDLGDMPDQVPTLAALAPFAEGSTVIRNVAHLRVKESDRLAAMASQLRRLGAAVEERADGLVVEGVWSSGMIPSDEITVETYDDHRVAMSLAICGLRRPGVGIDRPQVVGKSYPSFWRDLASLLRP